MHKLMYISQGKSTADHLKNIKNAVDSGAKLIQLRLKNISDEEFISAALSASETCQKTGAFLIINDHAMAAKACNAYGLHLGMNDMGIAEARRIFSGTIGGTANTWEDVLKRSEEKADYIGLGPYRFTTTKEKLSPILGTEGLRNILLKMRQANIHIPVFAIGGILEEDAHEIMETGVHGIAVSGLITKSEIKKLLIERLNKKIHHVEDRRQRI